MIIEVLYPDVANLHGDLGNVDYLTRCRPEAQVIKTALADAPAFATAAPDLVYLGAMTERGQLKVIERLRPHAARLRQLIEAGTVFLFTHNALEVMGARIVNAEMGYDAAGLGIFDFETTVEMFGRYSGKVMGPVGDTTVVGYKSQFSMVQADESLPPFLTASRGIGRNRATALEGVRVNNFIGTSLLGPLLIMNPPFTSYLLSLIDPDSPPGLAFEDEAMAAYRARLADFSDLQRWHDYETVKLR